MGDFYILGREMTHPRTSGLHFGDLSYDQLRALSTELTQEERAARSSDHYYEPMAELSEEHRKAIASGPMAPEACYLPEQAGEHLLNPAGDTVENGYGVLPNGVGYAAILIRQTGITDAMIRKYRDEFTWDGPRTLFYKTWYPGAHLVHYENGVVENFGWGMMNLEMEMEHFTLAHLGLKKEEIPQRDPHCISLLGFYGRGWEVACPENGPVYTCMVQHTRETPQGRELRVRYWSGLTFAPGGQVELHPDPDQLRTRMHMRMMMEHCMREYTNELRLMKQFWETGA